MTLQTSRAAPHRAMFLTLVLGTAWHMQPQEAKPYPAMAPPEQYMMERSAEIALARSAAPPSISGDAEIMVMGRHGYETAIKGSNGFVCLIERSWTSGIDDPDFWNPRLRAPICFNPPAARSVVPLTLKKTELVLDGRSRAQMAEAMKVALTKGDLLPLEPGAMCYMMSKQGYLNSRDGHWQPHLMFFVPPADAAHWGAGLPGSPIFASPSPEDRMTVLLVPIPKWSDGTLASMDAH